MQKEQQCQQQSPQLLLLLLHAEQLFCISSQSGCTINRWESSYSPKITKFLNMGYSCTEKSKYQVWNRGFSFSLAWRATVSTALVYNYWRHCWQQSAPCGLEAGQWHHISLVFLTHAYTAQQCMCDGNRFMRRKPEYVHIHSHERVM